MSATHSHKYDRLRLRKRDSWDYSELVPPKALFISMALVSPSE